MTVHALPGIADDDALERAVGVQRSLASMEADQWLYLLECLDECAADPDVVRVCGAERVHPYGGDGTPDIPEFAVCEVAGALRMTNRRASRLVADILDIIALTVGPAPSLEGRRHREQIRATERSDETEDERNLDDRYVALIKSGIGVEELTGSMSTADARRLDGRLNQIAGWLAEQVASANPPSARVPPHPAWLCCGRSMERPTTTSLPRLASRARRLAH